MFSADTYLQTLFERCIRSEEDLHDYQTFAVEWLKDNPFSALFIDVGLGKTIIILTLIDWLIQEREYRGKILIIAPIKVVNRVWSFEYLLWRHTAYLRYHNLRIEDDDPRVTAEYSKWYVTYRSRGIVPAAAVSFAKKKAKILQNRLRLEQIDHPAQIHCINQEAVPWLIEQFAVKQKNLKVREIREWQYPIVVFDEASRLRDHNSHIFLSFKKIRHRIERFHHLTATPGSQTYMYFFSMFWLLDEGERFGSFITHFQNRYFVRGYDGFSWELRPGGKEEIEIKIHDICLIMERKDYSDMEDPVILTVPVRLPRKIMQQYRDFERDMILEIPEDDFDLAAMGTPDVIEAETGASLSTKLLQLASGAVYDKTRKYHVYHDEKIDALKTILEQTLEQPVMVAYWFRSSLDRLKKAFPKAAVMDAQGKQEKPWNEGKYKVMFVHPAGVGHGLNLQAGGHHLVIFDLFWSLELFLQLIGRLNRQGQLHTVIVHLLSSVGTHDRVVSENLEVLKDAREGMFRRLKALRERMTT